MNKSQFIVGVFDQYPEKLLENRITIEGNVIGALWADPISIDEYNLSAKDFITKDGSFFFKVARMLRTQYKLNEFDEAAVLTHLTEELKDELDERGGYKEIKNLMDITSTKNIMVYVDELNKANLILKLYRSGFSLLNPIEDMNGKKVIAYEQMKKLDYQGALEWWEATLSTFANDASANSSILEEKTKFTITDDMISNLEEGQMVGTSFGYIDDTDINGNPIRVMPFLDAEVCSLRHGTTTALCGYSSVGKSMLLCGILLALVSHGERVCIISNEMNSTPYMLNFICFLAYRKFRYSKLTRSKLQSGEMTQEDKEVLKKTIYIDGLDGEGVIYQIERGDTAPTDENILLWIDTTSDNGVDTAPALVVAPTKVNFGRGILIVRALGPCPITQSISKSSIAMYSISSSAGFNLCISSIKKIEFSVTLVKIPAKSFGLSRAGALVILISECISLAIIAANVVLPNPGGPTRNV